MMRGQDASAWPPQKPQSTVPPADRVIRGGGGGRRQLVTKTDDHGCQEGIPLVQVTPVGSSNAFQEPAGAELSPPATHIELHGSETTATPEKDLQPPYVEEGELTQGKGLPPRHTRDAPTEYYR